ncbi:hypothetical protein RJT34_08819 [Clitoria ternatea]|uniref:Protein FAR1-RELATED SEQUENCE n=1 Tax=Clitoria ternatea TaxID=43366 RepID=A0AAN9PT02_CLITE
MRFKETKVDYDSLNGTLVLQSPLSALEKSACLTYTREVFKLFLGVLSQAGSCTIVGCNATPSLYIYVVNKFGHRDKQWHVSVHIETLEMKCSCLKIESVGIPCGHIVAVMVFFDIEELSNNLILLR